jgi:hypothetical protein
MTINSEVISVGEAKRRKKSDPNYGKPKLSSAQEVPEIFLKADNYIDRSEDYLSDTEYYKLKGGAFEDGLPRTHKYNSILQSELLSFISDAAGKEEQIAMELSNKPRTLSKEELQDIIDVAIMEKRAGNLNKSFLHYNSFFNSHPGEFLLWYGLAKLLCLFREFRMAFTCIKICKYLFSCRGQREDMTVKRNLPYHYRQIYDMAFKNVVYESYLKSLGRPLNPGIYDGEGRNSRFIGQVQLTNSKNDEPKPYKSQLKIEDLR